MRIIYMAAHIDPKFEMEFLEHIRTFDKTHDNCHFEIAIDVPDAKTAEIIDHVREAQRKLDLPLFGMVKKQ